MTCFSVCYIPTNFQVSLTFYILSWAVTNWIVLLSIVFLKHLMLWWQNEPSLHNTISPTKLHAVSLQNSMQYRTCLVCVYVLRFSHGFTFLMLGWPASNIIYLSWHVKYLNYLPYREFVIYLVFASEKTVLPLTIDYANVPILCQTCDWHRWNGGVLHLTLLTLLN